MQRRARDQCREQPGRRFSVNEQSRLKVRGGGPTELQDLLDQMESRHSN